MKFIVAIILTMILSFISGLLLPWWGIAIAAFIVGLIIPQGTGRSFLAGFLAVLLLWSGLATWISIRNDGVLAGKMALILPLGGNTFLLLLVTGIVGGIIGGFAAMTGSFLRSRGGVSS